MIYLLFGPDKERLNKRLRQIKAAAGVSNDGINYREIAADFDAATIISEAGSMPFLAEKRVVVLRGLLGNKSKELLAKIAEWLPQVPAETELILVENEAPDQRLVITKTLNKVGQVENFTNMTPIEAVKQIERAVVEAGGSIDKATASLLQMYLGTDSTRLTNEVNKLVSYDKKVTRESVELLVDAGYFNTIFDLTDAIATRNTKKALHNLEKILESGESEVYLVSMIAMQVRNLLIIQDLKAHGLSDSEMVSRSKLHPFVVKKCLGQIRNFTKEQLIAMHKGLLDLDVALKSGIADPKTLLTKYILDSII